MTEFRTPTGEQIKEAIRRIPTPQLRRAFFEGLKNPLWVEPLANEGVFLNPPEPEKTDDGMIRDIYWPEIDFLTRAAPESPQAVVDVLLKLRKTNNAWVRRGAFEIGAQIPADQAARLQPLIKSWQSSGLGWRTDPKDLVSYAVNLLQGGQYEVGKWVANLIFKPSKSQNRRKPGLTLEDYWYERGLPEVVQALGPDGLELVLSWLVAYERHDGRLTGTSDMTYFLRDSIRQSDDSIYKVEMALIDAVRDLAIEAMQVDAEATVNMLLSSNMLIARKIALFALGEALVLMGEDDKPIDGLLVLANELVSDEASIHDSCRIDYAELVRAVARTTGKPLMALTRVIDPGPRIDGERIRSWVRDGASDETEVDDRVRDYINGWKHRWLSALGTDALPAQLQAELAELDSTYGVIDGPLTPTKRITGWTGPNSPLDQDEMAAMTPAELVAHLESWHDNGNGWGPEPSHEGQGRELQGLLTTNPKALADVEGLIGRLRPTYLRAILQGWEASLKAGLDLDWAQVSDLGAAVLAHGDESDFPAEGGKLDDDLDFRPAKQAAVGFLEEVAQKRDSPVIPEDAMFQFAELIVTQSADETAWNEYIESGDHIGWDALTTSLNWQWPIRVRALTHLMSRGKDTPWYEAARSALEMEMRREDTPGASRAVIGEGLGRLIDVDPEWLTPLVPGWFGSAEELSVAQQIALTTAMAVHRYHPTLYELFREAMVAIIHSDEPIVSGWETHTDPVQRIGEWVIDAIIRGHKSLDDPLAHVFFVDAPASVRGEAIGHIAWSFMHASTVDDEIRDRFAQLWDERAAHVRDHPEDKEELNGFYWFVKSHKFSVEWWLPRLKEAAELAPGLSAERYMIGKEIASSADVDPRGAFDVVKLLLEGRDEASGGSFDLTRNAVPMVLARAIASGNEELNEDAVAYMNLLGEKGNLGLEAEVNKVIDGTITQSDVVD